MPLKYDYYIKWYNFPLEFILKDKHNYYESVQPEKIFKVYFKKGGINMEELEGKNWGVDLNKIVSYKEKMYKVEAWVLNYENKEFYVLKDITNNNRVVANEREFFELTGGTDYEVGRLFIDKLGNYRVYIQKMADSYNNMLYDCIGTPTNFYEGKLYVVRRSVGSLYINKNMKLALYNPVTKKTHIVKDDNILSEFIKDKMCVITGKMLEGNDYFVVREGYLVNNKFITDFAICDDCGDIVLKTEITEVDGKKLCSVCFDSKYFICADCGRITPIEELKITNTNNKICNTCFTDDYFKCDTCNNIFPNAEGTEIDGELICVDCRDRDYIYCFNCQRWVDNDGAIRIEGEPICADCIENDYWWCDDCNTYHHDGNECPYADRHAIHSYGFKPAPQFQGTGNKYFGIEWEVMNGGESGEKAIKIINGRKEIYAKHDGSLSRGIEFVTHPCTPEYHLKMMPYAEMLKTARDLGYRGVDGSGIHVHINRDFFTDEDNVGNLIRFFEEEWDSIIVFSRRKEHDASQWAGRYFDGVIQKDDTPKKILEKSKHSRNRYRAVNLCCDPTIELRVFRSTTELAHFQAIIQFVDVISDLANNKEYIITWNNINKLAIDAGYKQLVDEIKKYHLLDTPPTVKELDTKFMAV